MQLNNNAQWFMNFQNLIVALNPIHRLFLNFDKSCVLSYFEKLIITKFYPAVFQLSVPKTVIKGGFSRSYCCYGHLVCHKNDDNRRCVHQ